MSEANALAARLASAPPQALAATKAAIRASSAYSLNQALDHERDTQRRLGFSRDYAEGVAAFIEKRTPNFTGE